MKSIAIIGSGIAGLLAAHGLLKAGMAVTLYSDRSAEQWLNESRPTGTAARFDLAMSYERELGLNFWEQQAPKGEGIDLIFCPTLKNQFINLKGRFIKPFLAIDVRLQSHRWMNEFEARGGKLVIETVTLARLDQISAGHDLTIVAAGRADICNVFEPDASRSVHTQPARKLAMMVTTGGKPGFDGLPFTPVKFNLTATEGEAFWVPYFHKDAGPSWNMIFEAKPGSKIDRFDGAKSGDDVLAIGKQIIKEIFPWDYAWAKNMQLADPNGWLVGSFTPTVRRALGRLPSGRVVMALGDTRIAHDPVAGQGANTGQKMARHLVEQIVAHGDAAFDQAWIEQVGEDFYQQHGRFSYGFTNTLLQPLTPAGQELLIAQYGSTGLLDDHSGKQAVADAFCANFNDPRYISDLFHDVAATRAFISKTTGRSWLWGAVAGRAAVIKNQIRQKINAPVWPE